ncbi:MULTISPECIES: response regulator [Crateriforma]|nr:MULTISPECIES: response regulator [Crateriforma]
MTNLLFVDDDMNLLRGLRRSLRDQPYFLHVANSADQAMKLFKHRVFDVAVVDQRLDHICGLELLAWIRQHHPKTIRLMLTGHANVHVAQDAINRGGVFRFLTKPIRDVELAMAIREGLESREAANENNDSQHSLTDHAVSP